MSTLPERLAELARKVVGVDAKLISIGQERVTFSVEAAQGAQTAIRKIAELDDQVDRLQRSKRTFLDASTQLQEQLEEEERLAAAEDRAQRAAEAAKVGAAVCAINLELDTMLVQVRQAFERRAMLVDELRRIGGLSSALTFSMLGKEPPTSAARHAGLARYISIEPVPVSAVRPLAAANDVLPH